MGKADLKPVIQELAELPSRGKFYDGKIPETFSIRPMTVNELKMLYGSSNTMKALNSIIKSVVIDVEDFPVDDLLIGDKFYLAYKIRAITFGPEYNTTIKCPECGKISKVSIDLIDDIEIDRYPEDMENPRSIGKLPVSGDEITVKVISTGELERMLKRSEEISKKFPDYVGDPMYIESTAFQIDSINGKKRSLTDIEQYLMDMHAKDDLYIMHHLGKYSCGPKTPVLSQCPECGADVRVGIMISEDFFRPELDFE